MDDEYYTKKVTDLQPNELFCHYGRGTVPRAVQSVTVGPSKVPRRIGDGPWETPTVAHVTFVGVVGFTGPGTFEYRVDEELTCTRADSWKIQTGWHLAVYSSAEGVEGYTKTFPLDQRAEGEKELEEWRKANPRENYGWFGSC